MGDRSEAHYAKAVSPSKFGFLIAYRSFLDARNITVQNMSYVLKTIRRENLLRPQAQKFVLRLVGALVVVVVVAMAGPSVPSQSVFASVLCLHLFVL